MNNIIISILIIDCLIWLYLIICFSIGLKNLFETTKETPLQLNFSKYESLTREPELLIGDINLREQISQEQKSENG